MKHGLFRLFKNITIVLLLVTLGYSPVLYFNVYEDPFGVFTSDFNSKRIEPNNHFIKMRYLLSNTTDFDSFIFGSSRANNVDPKRFSNGNYYNMYYSLGVPKEHMEDIELLLEDGYKIKSAVVFLDYSSYSMTDKGHSKDMLRKPYPINRMDRLKTYVNYVFQIPDTAFVSSYYTNPSDSIYVNIYKTGRAENKKVEVFIEAHRNEHVNDPKFGWPYYGYENKVDSAILSIAALKKLCDANKINLTLVMNPIHKTTFLANDRNLYFDFITRVSEISDFYDFSGLNKITCNNYFYYEASHYRPIVGNAMIDLIQNNKRIDSIPDFGMYVTKQNISERVSTLKKQLELATPK